jgi:hypothetical protein
VRAVWLGAACLLCTAALFAQGDASAELGGRLPPQVIPVVAALADSGGHAGCRQTRFSRRRSREAQRGCRASESSGRSEPFSPNSTWLAMPRAPAESTHQEPTWLRQAPSR